MAKKVKYKSKHIHFKIAPETKQRYMDKIKEKGFSSITKAVGYANEKEFGVNTSE